MNSKDMIPKFFMAKEVAAMLRLSVKSIYNMVWQGRLKPYRLGSFSKKGRLLFTQEEINRFLRGSGGSEAA